MGHFLIFPPLWQNKWIFTVRLQLDLCTNRTGGLPCPSSLDDLGQDPLSLDLVSLFYTVRTMDLICGSQTLIQDKVHIGMQ